MAEANAKMELRDFVTAKDVDLAIATALTSFVQTQKHQVAEKLLRKFQTKYITAVTAHNELLHFLLKKLLKKRIDMNAIASTAEEQLQDSVASVAVTELKSEAAKMDIRSVDEYLESDLFLDSFEVENGSISRRSLDEALDADVLM